jgi:hypothetical protein
MATGCGAHSFRKGKTAQPNATGMTFVSASRNLIADCHATASKVGYPVPCPMKVPEGLVASGGRPDCLLAIIGPAKRCPKTVFAWRGWVVGSATTANEHLVLTASPSRLDNDAKVVNGPAWYPRARVKPIAWTTINGWRIRAVFVPAATNDGSAFSHHVVLIWSVGQHTYAVGFHDVTSIKQTLLRRDETLAHGIRLIEP